MKIKPSFLLIALLLALSAVSIYIFKSRSKSGSAQNDGRDFKFKDTAAITKIFIADKEGHSALVQRGKNGWIVNDKFRCRGDAILNLLEAIKHVEVKMPLDKNTRKSVIKFMSSSALKVEIYAGDELVKQFYVGYETPDSEGSYMLQTNLRSGENYKDPYVCFIPGFRGYLMPRFIADENEWRDRVVLNFIPPQIREITVQHLDEPADSSFSIQLANAKSFRLKNSAGADLPFDENKMKQYVAYFLNMSYEGLITGKFMRLQDSLSRQKPFCIIRVSTTDQGEKIYKFFRRKFDGVQDPEHGITYDYDPDRLYMRFENDKEWALTQYFVFGKLFITPLYFLPSASVKK